MTKVIFELGFDREQDVGVMSQRECHSDGNYVS